FQELAHHRRGKRGQEFFEVDIEHPKQTIIDVCLAIDRDVAAQREAEAEARRVENEKPPAVVTPVELAISPPLSHNTLSIYTEIPPASAQFRWIWLAIVFSALALLSLF